MLALRTKYHFGGISSSSEGAHLSGKILEYTFKPTKSGPLTILNLGDYSLQIQIEGHDESVAYASIVSVRLVKESGKNYKLFLYPDGRAPVAIQNYSFSDGGGSTGPVWRLCSFCEGFTSPSEGQKPRNLYVREWIVETLAMDRDFRSVFSHDFFCRGLPGLYSDQSLYPGDVLNGDDRDHGPSIGA